MSNRCLCRQQHPAAMRAIASGAPPAPPPIQQPSSSLPTAAPPTLDNPSLGGIRLLIAVVLKCCRRVALGGLGRRAGRRLHRLLGLQGGAAGVRGYLPQLLVDGSGLCCPGHCSAAAAGVTAAISRRRAAAAAPRLPHLLLRLLLLLLRELLAALELAADREAGRGGLGVPHRCITSGLTPACTPSSRSSSQISISSSAQPSLASCSAARPSRRAAPPHTFPAASKSLSVPGQSQHDRRNCWSGRARD